MSLVAAVIMVTEEEADLLTNVVLEFAAESEDSDLVFIKKAIEEGVL